MNSQMKQLELERTPHPGEILVEYLEWAGWSQQEFAKRTGLTPKTISEICNGKAPISAHSAIAFEPVLGRPAQLWLSLQRRFDEKRARKSVREKQGDWKAWAKKFPVKEMITHDWISTAANTGAIEASQELLRFFSVSSPESWDKTWSSLRVAYRRSDLIHANRFAVAAWVRASEIEASEIATSQFDQRKAEALVTELRTLTRKAPEQYFSIWKEACADAGIALVVLPTLQGTSISGAARWLTDSKALIALTPRYRTDDQLWLTFFHELGHLLLHKNKFRFVIDAAEESVTDGSVDFEMAAIEREANSFADDALIPKGHLSKFLRKESFSCDTIERFADEINVGPGIVVGRLQRDGYIGYNSCNHLKRKIGVAQAAGS